MKYYNNNYQYCYYTSIMNLLNFRIFFDFNYCVQLQLINFKLQILDFNSNNNNIKLKFKIITV